MVLFEDSAAMIGIALAALGIYASSSLGLAVLDGVASILIGLMLAAISILLARESKSLLIGERADGGLAASILQIAAAQPGIEHAHGIFTIHLAPDQIVAALNVSFADTLCARDVERAVSGIERQIQSTHPDVMAVFIKPQTRQTLRTESERHLAAGDTSPSSDPSAAAL